MITTLRWFRSSYSSDAGGQCVEVAYAWRKSSYSNPSGGDCVEVAACPHTVHVRDSKNLGPTLSLTPTAWAGFAGWAARS
ncbi:DUF397 domain-containing protein [Streptomyces sp. NPDC101733]|uniref:DUF397 domain-containing protein n=1 Tax=unclassified Streptomyces TaxID=2593676 RepID=UPI00380871F8